MTKSIHDPHFKYYSALNTDLRRTFSKARRQLRDQATPRSAALPEIASVTTSAVLPLVKRRKVAG